MDENLKIIYDLLTEVRKDQKAQGKELASQSKCLAKLEMHVAKNTADLTEHKEGVVGNRTLIADAVARIEKLEEPGKIKSFIYNKYVKVIGLVSISLGVISTIIYIVTRLLPQ